MNLVFTEWFMSGKHQQYYTYCRLFNKGTLPFCPLIVSKSIPAEQSCSIQTGGMNR